jgi:hypothetical protein
VLFLPLAAQWVLAPAQALLLGEVQARIALLAA